MMRRLLPAFGLLGILVAPGALAGEADAKGPYCWGPLAFNCETCEYDANCTTHCTVYIKVGGSPAHCINRQADVIQAQVVPVE